jgi:hypothetical protein
MENLAGQKLNIRETPSRPPLGFEIIKNGDEWRITLDSDSKGIQVHPLVGQYLRRISRIYDLLKDKEGTEEAQKISELLGNINCHKIAFFAQGRITLKDLVSDIHVSGRDVGKDHGLKKSALLNKIFAPKFSTIYELQEKISSGGVAFPSVVSAFETPREAESRHSFLVLGVDEKGRMICFDKSGGRDYPFTLFVLNGTNKVFPQDYKWFAVNPNPVVFPEKQ